jgi:hypothetical protein
VLSEVCITNRSIICETDKTRSSQPGLEEPTNLQVVPRFRYQDVSTDKFRRHWEQGTPVVVTGITMQGRWDPEYFMRAHGDKKVTIIECETGKTQSSSVANFFKGFGQPRGRVGIWKLKVCLCLVCFLW